MNFVFPGLSRPHPTKTPNIIVGLGARAAATTPEVLTLIEKTLAAHGLSRADIAALATADHKAEHPALLAAAAALDVPLIALGADDLDVPVPNPSTTVLAHIGIASVAEAAALSLGSLIATKTRSPNVTCALSRRDQTQSPISVSSASMFAASAAGR